MSCPFSQAGGAVPRATKVAVIPGTERELRNGAKGAMFTLSNGKKGFRITEGAKVGMRVPPRAITQAEAQAAFNKYYSKINKVRRGPRKGSPRFASPTGLRSARTYDINHTKKPVKVVRDSRYLSPSGPYQYDYPGVDTGAMVRKPLSQRQADNLLVGRKSRAAKHPRRAPLFSANAPARTGVARRPQVLQDEDMELGSLQQGGYWW